MGVCLSGVWPLIRSGAECYLVIGRPKSTHNFLLLCKQTFQNPEKSDQNGTIQLSFNFSQCKYLANKCFNRCGARNTAWNSVVKGRIGQVPEL